MCFSLNLPNDQLADMAIAGMLPAVREKLFGMEFDNLGQLSIVIDEHLGLWIQERLQVY
jgi:hypothetical protein